MRTRDSRPRARLRLEGNARVMNAWPAPFAVLRAIYLSLTLRMTTAVLCQAFVGRWTRRGAAPARIVSRRACALEKFLT